MDFEIMEKVPIENTIMKKRTDEAGNIVSYRIYPAEGFLLHSNTLDEVVIDDVTRLPTEDVTKRYTKAFATVGAEYDFDENPRGIYAIKEGEKSKDE